MVLYRRHNWRQIPAPRNLQLRFLQRASARGLWNEDKGKSQRICNRINYVPLSNQFHSAKGYLEKLHLKMGFEGGKRGSVPYILWKAVPSSRHLGERSWSLMRAGELQLAEVGGRGSRPWARKWWESRKETLGGARSPRAVKVNIRSWYWRWERTGSQCNNVRRDVMWSKWCKKVILAAELWIIVK